MIKNISFLHSVVKLPLLNLPVQTVIVELANAKILISPGSQLTQNQLEQIGPVSHIMAPSLLHCGGILNAQKVFPNAQIWGPPDCRKQKSKMNWHAVLFSDPWPFEKELSIHWISGMPKIQEVVFYHPLSKSLIVTDLFFNLQNPKGSGAWFILNLFGNYKKFAISKFYLKYVEDKNSFKKSLNHLLQLDIENVIVSHGENLIGDGKSNMQSAIESRNLIL